MKISLGTKINVVKKIFSIILLMVLLGGNSYALTLSDLTNKDWILKSIHGIGINPSSYTGKKPRIKFFEDLRFSAWAGCNEISGNYNFTEPDILNFGQNMIMTQMACNTTQNVEDDVISALHEIQTVNINAHLMQLLDANGKVLAEYTSL